MKKIFRFAIILAAVLAAGFLVLFGVYSVQKKPLFHTSYDNADRYSAGSFSCDAGEIDEIDISWLTGTLRFKKASGRTLNVTEASETLTEMQQVRWWLDGRTLRIRYWASNYGTDTDMGKSLTLEIPDGIALTVRTGKSRCGIQMESHHLKELSLQIGTGDIEAGDLTAEKSMLLENGGGSTSIRSVTAQSVRFDTLLGDVRIDNVSVGGSLEMRSVRAKLSLGVVKAESVVIEKYEGVQMGLGGCGKVDIRTNRGDITLVMKHNAGATVRFTSGGGILNGKAVIGSEQLVIGDGSCAVSVDAADGSLIVR